MSHLLFISYARNDRDENLERFLSDLTREIRGIRGEAHEEILFVDSSVLKPGDSWPTQLVEEIRSARAFVYIQSPSYFNRSWCGKEWSAFLLRFSESISRGDISSPLMMPVNWIPEDTPPPCARKIQFASKDLGQTYADEGLRYLMRLRSHQEDYQKFLTSFAKRVTQVIGRYTLFAPPQIPPVEDLPNAFEASEQANKLGGITRRVTGPRCVQFVYIAASSGELTSKKRSTEAYGHEAGSSWKPYHPENQDEVWLLSQRIATAERFCYEIIKVNDNLSEKIRQAQSDNKVVLLIADPWTLTLDKYMAIASSYDEKQFYNSKVLVVMNPSDIEVPKHLPLLTSAARRAFLNSAVKNSPDSYKENIESTEELEAEITHSLQRLRQRIKEASKIVRSIKKVEFVKKPTLQLKISQ